MSESVRIGGIGKNPAIDKINSLNAIDIKNFARNRMLQIVLSGDYDSSIVYGKRIPLHLDQVEWEEQAIGGEQRTGRMAGNKLPGGQNASKASGKLYEAVRGNGGGEVPGQTQTTGDIQHAGRGQNPYIQFAGQALAGGAGISGDHRDAESN